MSSVSRTPRRSRRAAAISFALAVSASTCLVASAVWEPTWKVSPRTPIPRPAASRASGSTSSGSQPNLRDRSHTAPGEAELLLRVSFRAPGAVCDLSRKFGCDPEDVLPLARLAAGLGIGVRGLAVQVGSQTADAAQH